MKHLTVKASTLLPEIVKQPRLAVLGARGVHLGSFLTLQRRWIIEAGISTVIDIGANTGQFAGVIHELLPSARIYSFEPLPECYRKLNRRLAGAGAFEAFEVAIGDESSRITFYRNDFAQSSSPLVITDAHEKAFPWTRNATPIEVEVRTLDSFLNILTLKKKILVKIDVQGFEGRVLRGGAQVLKSSDIVFIESSFEPLYEGQESFDTIHAIMVGYGFRFAGIIDQLADPRSGRTLQADLLYLRRDAPGPATGVDARPFAASRN